MQHGTREGRRGPESIWNVRRHMERMRVLLFYYTEFSLVGGVETVVLKLAKSLVERGCPAAIVELSDKWKPERKVEGVPLLSISASRYPTWKEPRSWASFARSIVQLRKVCRMFKADILHVHFPVGQCLPLVGACTFPRRWGLVTTLHGSDIRVYPRGNSRVRVWQDRLFRHSDAVTSVSDELLQEAVGLYPSIAAKGIVIHNGVSRAWFEKGGPTDGKAEKYALFVGRLHPIKAVDVLVRAWKLAYSRLDGDQLWLVGDGAERERLFDLVRDLGIESGVRFLGKKSSDEVRKLYLSSQFVVLPSRHEGLPMVLIEAGACGAIRLGTRVPGITELIADGETGFLVEPESPEALAEGLIRAATLGGEDRRRMSRATRESVSRRFSHEEILSQYLNLYRGLAGAKSVPSPSAAKMA